MAHGEWEENSFFEKYCNVLLDSGSLTEAQRAVFIGGPANSPIKVDGFEDHPLQTNGIFTLIKKFQSMDIWTIGLDMNGAQSIENFDVGNQFLAFFIGSEENGLSNEIQNKLDLL